MGEVSAWFVASSHLYLHVSSWCINSYTLIKLGQVYSCLRGSSEFCTGSLSVWEPYEVPAVEPSLGPIPFSYTLGFPLHLLLTPDQYPSALWVHERWRGVQIFFLVKEKGCRPLQMEIFRDHKLEKIKVKPSLICHMHSYTCNAQWNVFCTCNQ